MTFLEFDKNEKKYAGIEITEVDGASLTVISATFLATDSAGTSAQAVGNATITNNISTAVQLYGLIDTSAAGFAAGGNYIVIFTVVIGSETYIWDFPMKVKD